MKKEAEKEKQEKQDQGSENKFSDSSKTKNFGDLANPINKKEVKKVEEKSEELEEKVDEIIQEREVLRLFQPVVMRNSPTLETQQTRTIPRLEEDIASVQVETKTAQKENRPVNYATGIEQRENRNYTAYTSSPTLLPTNQPARRSELIDPFKQRNFIEENLRPNMVETGSVNMRRKLPFEQEDRKYKEVKI
ncbi:MAG: hypothetical protein Q7R52_01010 [archaeon]|nr:hypothetical protein [archaeon]